MWVIDRNNSIKDLRYTKHTIIIVPKNLGHYLFKREVKMKKLLLASLLLGSISSYSMTKFEEDLSQDEAILQNSKNYRS